MRKSAFLITMAALQLSLASSSEAVIIVDTGVPTLTPGVALAGFQWLAAEFTVTDPHVLSTIEAYTSIGTGTFTVALYADGGDVPSTTQLFSGTATDTSSIDGWVSLDVSGMAWNLLAGTYWVSFEVRPGNTFSGGMPISSPNALGNEAVRHSPSPWFADDTINIGVRIAAENEPAPVPEPSTLALLTVGLAAVKVRRRRRSSERP